MTLEERISAFSRLGKSILFPCNNHDANRLWDTAYSAHLHNSWFTPDFCRIALETIAESWLNENALNEWIGKYPSTFFRQNSSKKVAVIMAGNIPLVGFHDFLCVLMAGHKFLGKFSSKDGGLMQAVINLLQEIEPRFSDQIFIAEGKIEGFDAAIATGSNNTSRYFEYYFGKYPNIIRKNRNSIAILSGNESFEDLELLADDIFLYFGLGCRNVSKIFVPQGYSFQHLFQAFEKYHALIDHNKYGNNYEYYKAIFLINQVEHFDTGFLLVKPENSLGSPVGVLYFQHYDDVDSINSFIVSNSEMLQCVISSNSAVVGSIPFGFSQKPALNDYADGVDTLKFLSGI